MAKDFTRFAILNFLALFKITSAAAKSSSALF